MRIDFFENLMYNNITKMRTGVRTKERKYKMKIIESFENAKSNKRVDLREMGINPTMYWAYLHSKDVGNELIDFHEVIWEADIPEIVRACREYDIREFTISSTFSSLIETLAEFEKLGCKMFGLMEVNASYTNWQTGKNAVIPAIKMVL